MIDLTKYNGTYYIAHNIVKIRANVKDMTVGIFMLNGDTDWIECKSVEETAYLAGEIAEAWEAER